MCPRLHAPPALSIGVALCLLGVLVVFAGIGSVTAGTAAAQSSVTNETVTTESSSSPTGRGLDHLCNTRSRYDNEVTAFARRQPSSKPVTAETAAKDSTSDLLRSEQRAIG
jgi:hypothetical protein